MPNKINLAVVIPAFKERYLRAALSSIANQTSKNFTLYIGDDASPHDLYAIIKDFESDINIVYKRFATNLGGSDLVAQWERCIDMVQDEEWIWLFSDDDVMDLNCVDAFYQQLNSNTSYDIYRFDLNLIDSNGENINLRIGATYPAYIGGYGYYKKRLSGKLNSFVIEYIFRKKKFYEIGRFQNFDLAWGSDVATWVKISYKNGIIKIPNSKVNWRRSDENISPNNTEPIAIRKINAVIEFLLWSKAYFKSNGKDIFFFNNVVFLKRLKFYAGYISNAELDKSLRKYATTLSNPTISYFILKYFLWFYRKI